MNNHSESGAIPENPPLQTVGAKEYDHTLFWSSAGARRRPPAFSR